MSTPEITPEQIAEIKALLKAELEACTAVEPDESGVFPISQEKLRLAIERFDDKKHMFSRTASLFLHIMENTEESVEDAETFTALANSAAAAADRKAWLDFIIQQVLTQLQIGKSDPDTDTDTDDTPMTGSTHPLRADSSPASQSSVESLVDAEEGAGAARDLTQELADATPTLSENTLRIRQRVRANRFINQAFGAYTKLEGGLEKIGAINLFIERLSDLTRDKVRGTSSPVLLTEADIENFKFLLETWNLLCGKEKIPLGIGSEEPLDGVALKLFNLFSDAEENALNKCTVLIDGDKGLYYYLEQLDKLALFRSVTRQLELDLQLNADLKARYQRIDELLATPADVRVSHGASIHNYKLLLDILTGKQDIAEHLGNADISIAALLGLFQHDYIRTAANQQKLTDLLKKLLKLDVITDESINKIIGETLNPPLVSFATYADLYKLTDAERAEVNTEKLKRLLQDARSKLYYAQGAEQAAITRLRLSESDRSALKVLNERLEEQYDELVRKVEALKTARGEEYLALPAVEKDRISELQSQKEGLREIINQLRKELDEAKLETEQKQEEVNRREDFEGIAQSLSQRLRAEQATVHRLQAEQVALAAQHSQLQQEKVEAERRAAELVETKKRLSAEIRAKDDAEISLDDARAEAAKLQKANEELQQNNRRLQGVNTQLSEVRSDLERVTAQVEAKKEEITELRAGLTAQKSAYEQKLTSVTQESRAEVAASEAKVGELRLQLKGKECSIAELESRLQAERQRADEISKTLQTKGIDEDKIIELNKELSELRASLNKLEEEKSAQETIVVRLEKNLADITKELESYKERAMAAEAQVATHDAEMRRIQAEFDKESAEFNSALDESHAASRIRIAAFEATIARNDQDLAEKNQAIERLQQEIKRLIAQKEGDHGALSKQLSELSKAKSELETEVTGLKSDIFELQKQLVAAQASHDATLAQQKSVFEAEKQHLLDDIAGKELAIKSYQEEYNRKLEELQKQHESKLAAEKEPHLEKVAEIARLESELKSSQEQLQKLQADHAAQIQQLKKLNEESHAALLAQVTHEQQRAIAAEANVARLQGVVDENSAALEAARSRAADAEGRLSAVQAAHAAELKKLDKHHASLIRRLNTNIEDLEQKNRKLLARLVAAKAQIAGLNGEIMPPLSEDLERLIAWYEALTTGSSSEDKEVVSTPRTPREMLSDLSIKLSESLSVSTLQIQQLKAEVEKLKRQLEANARETESKLAEKQKAIDSQEKLYQKAMDANTKLREDYEVAKQSLISERDAAVAKERANAEFIAKKAAEFEHIMSSRSEEFLETYSAKSQILLASTLKLAGEQLKLTGDRNSTLEQSLQLVNTEKDRLTADKAGLEAELAELNKNLVSQQRRVSELEAQNTELQGKVAEYEAKEDELTAELTRVKSLLEDRQQAFTALQKSLSEQLATKERDHKTVVAELQSKIESLGSEGAAKSAEVAGLQQRITDLQASHRTVIAEMSLANAAALADQQAIVDAQAVGVTALQSEIENIKKAKAAAQEQIKRLESSLALRRRMNSRLFEQTKTLRGTILEKDNLIAAQAQTIAELTGEIARLKAELSLAQSRDTEQQRALATATAEREKLEAALAASQEENRRLQQELAFAKDRPDLKLGVSVFARSVSPDVPETDAIPPSREITPRDEFVVESGVRTPITPLRGSLVSEAAGLVVEVMPPLSSPVAVPAPAPAPVVQPSPRRIAPSELSPDLLSGSTSGSVLGGGGLFASPTATPTLTDPESPAAGPIAELAIPTSTLIFGTPMSVPATPVSARAVQVPAAPTAVAESVPAPPAELHEEDFTSAHMKKDPYRASVAPDSKILKVTAARINEADSDELEKQHRKTALALEVFLMTYLAGSGKGQKPVLIANGSDPELVALYCAFVKMFHDAGLESNFTNARSDVTDELIAKAREKIDECFDVSAAASIASDGIDKSVVDKIIGLYLIGRESDEAQYSTYVDQKMGWGSTTPKWSDKNSLFRGRHADAINRRSAELSPVLEPSMSRINSTLAATTASGTIGTAGAKLVEEIERTLIEANGITDHEHRTPTGSP